MPIFFIISVLFMLNVGEQMWCPGLCIYMKISLCSRVLIKTMKMSRWPKHETIQLKEN